MRNILLHLDRQNYPQYEIIVIDDYSDPGEQSDLETMIFRLPEVFLFRSDRAPGKKHALSMGIEKARHALILCTDADGIPAGPDWIKIMVSKTSGNEMVLGYAPYFKRPGRLNQFIRFETIMTGIQYLSWSMLGRPYMGVGRNLLFPKNAFTRSNPYKHSGDVPYGDDDLFVQAVGNKIPVTVSLHPDTFVYSEPASGFRQWINQKHRHLSAGRYYSFQAWLQPGIFGIGIILHWLLLLPVLWVAVSPGMVIAFFTGIFIRWVRFAGWAKRLGDKDTSWLYPWYETGYALYLGIMGIFTMAVKKKSWN